jgi:hypothetical protein
VVLTIELEGALLAMPGAPTPAKLASPYRAPLTKFLVKYAPDAIAYFLDPTRMLVTLALYLAVPQTPDQSQQSVDEHCGNGLHSNGASTWPHQRKVEVHHCF